MKIKIHKARKHLPLLVKAALAGADVTIVSRGDEMVRLVPVARQGLRGWGNLRQFAAGIDAAFTPEVDGAVARALQNRT